MEPRTIHYTRRRIPVSVTLPTALLEEVDECWQRERSSRSVFFEGALREALKRGARKDKAATTEASV